MWVFSSKLSLLFKITIWGALGSKRAGKRSGSPSLPCSGLKSSCHSHSSTPRSFEFANGNHLSEVHTRESWLVRSTCKGITGNSSSGEISSDLTGPKGICQVGPQPCERTRCPGGRGAAEEAAGAAGREVCSFGSSGAAGAACLARCSCSHAFQWPVLSIPRGRRCRTRRGSQGPTPRAQTSRSSGPPALFPRCAASFGLHKSQRFEQWFLLSPVLCAI